MNGSAKGRGWVRVVRGSTAGLFALALVAGCGGDRRTDSAATGADAAPAADTAAAVSPMDTVAAVLPDTSRDLAAVTDTSAPTTTPGSAVARRSTADTAAAGTGNAAAPAPKPKPAPKPAAEAEAAAPAPAAPPAETQAAAAPQQDTQPAAAPQETTAAQPQAEEPAQDAPLRDEYHQAPRDTVVQAVYDGWKQYNLNCARCHGEDVLGTTIAPHLITSVKPEGPINTKESFMQVVCAGRPELGMPAWCPLGLEMEKIEQIYSYVKGRSDGEIGPGRPALRQGG